MSQYMKLVLLSILCDDGRTLVQYICVQSACDHEGLKTFFVVYLVRCEGVQHLYSTHVYKAHVNMRGYFVVYLMR